MSSSQSARSAAFFDVDGTLARTTVVHYYVYFRRRRMRSWLGTLWYTAFLAKCLYYLLLDRIDRNRFNVAFYRSYKGLSTEDVKRQVPDCYRDVILPRRYEQAAACVSAHRHAGRRIVLVTGSVDFVMAPLASDLGADHVLAARLAESNGRFTGQLDGPPVAQEEKANMMQRFAAEHGVTLGDSYAYGDSVADLSMLEAVGHPQVVNPDRRLAAIARARRWPIHRWTLPEPAARRA